MPKVKWYKVLDFDDVLGLIVCTFTIIVCTTLTIGYIYQGEHYKVWLPFIPPAIFAVIGLAERKDRIENNIAIRQLEIKLGDRKD